MNFKRNSAKISSAKNAEEMMTQEENKVKCPMCGRIKAMKDNGDGTYWCDHCKANVDPRED
jgi:ribosomal protein L37AE/L43A